MSSLSACLPVCCLSHSHRLGRLVFTTGLANHQEKKGKREVRESPPRLRSQSPDPHQSLPLFCLRGTITVTVISQWHFSVFPFFFYLLMGGGNDCFGALSTPIQTPTLPPVHTQQHPNNTGDDCVPEDMQENMNYFPSFIIAAKSDTLLATISTPVSPAIIMGRTHHALRVMS